MASSHHTMLPPHPPATPANTGSGAGAVAAGGKYHYHALKHGSSQQAMHHIPHPPSLALKPATPARPHRLPPLASQSATSASGLQSSLSTLSTPAHSASQPASQPTRPHISDGSSNANVSSVYGGLAAVSPVLASLAPSRAAATPTPSTAASDPAPVLSLSGQSLSASDRTPIPDIQPSKHVSFVLRFPDGRKKTIKGPDSQTLGPVLAIVQDRLHDHTSRFALVVHDLVADLAAAQQPQPQPQPQPQSKLLTAADGENRPGTTSSSRLSVRRVPLWGDTLTKTVRDEGLAGQVALVTIDDGNADDALGGSMGKGRSTPRIDPLLGRRLLPHDPSSR
ncbi:hypothetical protein BC831DRAFT_452187 [Entophlyctis helioformis]|nr:hypothetical protein BC831DRAFT_452187 [Entophlyctis helioformis]